jgi:hypothetical protein
MDDETSKNPAKADILRFWKGLLREMYEFSDADLDRWAGASYSTMPDSYWQWHRGVVAAVVHLLLPDKLLVAWKKEFSILEKEVYDAIGANGIAGDFPAMKNQLVSLVESHGFELEQKRVEDLVTWFEWRNMLCTTVGDSYIFFWRGFLRLVPEWPESVIEPWCEEQKERLATDMATHYCTGPAGLLSPYMIPSSLHYRLEINWFDLERKVYDAIDESGQWQSNEYDFVAAKSRLEAVLSEYGAKIPYYSEPLTHSRDYAITYTPYFVRFSAQMLKTVLNWTDADFSKWVKPHWRELAGEVDNSMFFHGGALEHVIPSIIEVKLEIKECLGVFASWHASLLERELDNTLNRICSSGMAPEFCETYDFAKAKEKVERLITKYAERIG